MSKRKVGGFTNCCVCLKDLPPRSQWLDPLQVVIVGSGEYGNIPVHTDCYLKGIEL